MFDNITNKNHFKRQSSQASNKLSIPYKPPSQQSSSFNSHHPSNTSKQRLAKQRHQTVSVLDNENHLNDSSFFPLPKSQKEYQDQKKLLDLVLTSLDLKLNDLNLSSDPINEDPLLTSGLDDENNESYSIISSNKKLRSGGETEKQLRQENMALRQEILKLKKALFFSNQQQYPTEATENRIETTLSQMPLEEETPDKEEPILPLKEAPQPCTLQPLKPEVSFTCSNQLQRLLNEAKSLEPYPYNDNFAQIYYGGNQQIANMNLGQGTDDRYEEDTETNMPNLMSPRGGIFQQQETPVSVDTNKIRDHTFNMIEKSNENLKLRDKKFDRSQTERTPEPNMGQKKPKVEQEEREEGFHIRKEFLDENEEGFDEKKGMSSYFEEKRHYEQELQVLKNELEDIKQEEQKIKGQITKDANGSGNQSHCMMPDKRDLMKKFTPILSQRKVTSVHIPQQLLQPLQVSKENKEFTFKEGICKTSSMGLKEIKEEQFQTQQPQLSSILEQQKKEQSMIQDSEKVESSSEASIISLNIISNDHPLPGAKSTEVTQQIKVGQSVQASAENSGELRQPVVQSFYQTNQTCQQTSPKLRVIRRPVTVLSQGATEKGLMDSRKFNTEAIDEIFENQNAKRFKCLDYDEMLDDSKEDSQRSQSQLPASSINKSMSTKTIEQFQNQMKINKKNHQSNEEGEQEVTVIRIIEQDWAHQFDEKVKKVKKHDLQTLETTKSQSALMEKKQNGVGDSQQLKKSNSSIQSFKQCKSQQREEKVIEHPPPSSRREYQTINHAPQQQYFNKCTQPKGNNLMMERNNSKVNMTTTPLKQDLDNLKRSNSFITLKTENKNNVLINFKTYRTKLQMQNQRIRDMSNKRKEINKDYEDAYCDQQADSRGRNHGQSITYGQINSNGSSNSQNPNNQESTTPRFQDKSINQKEVVDVEYLYKMKQESTVKRREDQLKKSEEQKKKKLDDKLARIDNLKSKRDQEKQIQLMKKQKAQRAQFRTNISPNKSFLSKCSPCKSPLSQSPFEESPIKFLENGQQSNNVSPVKIETSVGPTTLLEQNSNNTMYSSFHQGQSSSSMKKVQQKELKNSSALEYGGGNSKLKERKNTLQQNQNSLNRSNQMNKSMADKNNNDTLKKSFISGSSQSTANLFKKNSYQKSYNSTQSQPQVQNLYKEQNQPKEQNQHKELQIKLEEKKSSKPRFSFGKQNYGRNTPSHIHNSHNGDKIQNNYRSQKNESAQQQQQQQCQQQQNNMSNNSGYRQCRLAGHEYLANNVYQPKHQCNMTSCGGGETLKQGLEPIIERI